MKNYPSFPQRDFAFISGIRIGNKLNGSRYWHRYYKFPDASFRFVFGTLGNKNVLGNITGLLYELGFNQKLSDKIYLYEMPSFGLAYFNHPYNEIHNPQNILTGSSFTFFASAAIQLHYYFSPYWSGGLQAAIFHSSDSHYQLPNLGVNLPTIGATVRYHIQPFSFLFQRNDSLSVDKKIRFNIRLSIGHNEQGTSTGPVSGPKYPIYLVAVYGTKLLSPINKVHVGLEAYYNTGVFDFITSQEFYKDKFFQKSTAIIFDAGHEFLLGHFSLMTNGGIYIYNPFYRDKLKSENITDLKNKLKTWLIARLGFQYYLNDATFFTRHNLFAGVYVKTNLGQADFLETGVGYTF